MTWEVGDEELRAVLALSGDRRYRYLVSRSARYGELWGLDDDNGWLLAEGEQGGDVFPVWPHRRFAAACAEGPWSDGRPRGIDVDEWVHVWTEGLQRDGLAVVVFPTPAEVGVVVRPGRLAADLSAELEQFT